MANFEAFCWNFLSHKNIEIGRSYVFSNEIEAPFLHFCSKYLRGGKFFFLKNWCVFCQKWAVQGVMHYLKKTYIPMPSLINAIIFDKR